MSVLIVSEAMVSDCFFFFKQKTAYELLRSLVGSEMCIRDRIKQPDDVRNLGYAECASLAEDIRSTIIKTVSHNGCLLYTSDAADDLLCVDLGGRRIIKKKNI